jgi:hypothetical protein
MANIREEARLFGSSASEQALDFLNARKTWDSNN